MLSTIITPCLSAVLQHPASSFSSSPHKTSCKSGRPCYPLSSPGRPVGTGNLKRDYWWVLLHRFAKSLINFFSEYRICCSHRPTPPSSRGKAAPPQNSWPLSQMSWQGPKWQTHSSRYSCICQSGKASLPHWPGAMGTWASFSWFYYCGIKGISLLSYL